MSRVLVLAAESSRAKLFKAETKAAPLKEVEDFVNPEGRLHEGDLVSDDPGEDGGGGGFGPHQMDEEVEVHEAVAMAFAKQLAERLERERVGNGFDELVLIAPPKFLGYLRDKLSPELASLVTETIDKNLVRLPAAEIREKVSVLL